MENRFDRPSVVSKSLVVLIIVFTIIPILWLVLLSFKTNQAIMMETMKLPESWNLDNFRNALNKLPFLTMTKNSLINVVLAVPLELIFAFFAAFAISRNRSFSRRNRENLRMFFVCGMIVPASVMLYPLYAAFIKLGIDNTLWGVSLIQVGWAMPLGVLNLVNAIDGIPESLEEAAVLDGCSIWQLAFRVYLPLIKPALATLAIVYFLGVWNSFLLNRTFLTGVETMTLSMMPTYFKGAFSTDYAMMTAASVILIAPQLAVYAALQKFIISGSVAGAVKG